MPSVIKVDQIQSDTGTVNLTSNVAFSGSAATMQIGNALYLANTNNFALQFQPDVAGRLRIASSVSSFGDNNPFLIERPSSVGIQNDAITIRSGGVVDLGKGQLKFPASQNASSDPNTLDDYEEGTWTPSWSSVGATWSYTPQYGQYIKIGRLVKAQFYLYATASGTTSNTVVLEGLPFTSANLSPYSQDAAPVWFSGSDTLEPLVNNNSTSITPWRNRVVAIATAALVSGQYFVGTAIYYANA